MPSLRSVPFVLRILCGCLLLVLPGTASAQGALEELAIREASALVEAGDHRGAVEVLQRARVLAPGPRIDVNLAVSLGAIGALSEARELLTAVVANETANPLVVEEAEGLLARVEARLARVTVTTEETARDAILVVDGQRRGPVQEVTEVALDPGSHVFEVRRPSGVTLARHRRRVREGDAATIELRPVSAPLVMVAAPAGPSASMTSAAPPAAEDLTPWIVIGASAAAVVIAGVVAAIVLASTASGSSELDPIMVGER